MGLRWQNYLIGAVVALFLRCEFGDKMGYLALRNFLVCILWSLTAGAAVWATQDQPGAPQNLPRAPTAATPPAGPVSGYTPLTGSEKWHYYLKSTYGPVAAARVATWSAVNQAQDTNPEWGQGMEGYGKRVASKFGQYAIKRSVAQGLGALLNEDPRYFASTRTGIMPRAAHALAWTFITRKDDGGNKFAEARVIGTFTGSLVSRAWYPEGERSVRNGLESGAISIAIDAGWNVFKEFWPDVRRRLRH